jgi:hypothetical protein
MLDISVIRCFLDNKVNLWLTQPTVNFFQPLAFFMDELGIGEKVRQICCRKDLPRET